ncbi:MAG: LysM peptidoglycan-binding domain-containing protein [Actinomycetales bacterium]
MSTLMVAMPSSKASRPARPAASRPARVEREAVAPASLRLTRRGRLLVSLTIAATAAVGLSVGLHGSAQASDTVSTRAVVVEPGQSLWQIARSVSPQRDPRDVIADIVAINHLGGVTVQAGQQLQVPVAH